MDVHVRRLEAADAEVARQLGMEAFGVPTTPPTTPAAVDQPGMTWFGAFQDGTLQARMVDRQFGTWFGGAALPTSGIAGVTVVAEARGRGLLTPLFDATLRHAAERGALVSALFPTAPRIYRRFGYEVIGSFRTVRLPSHVLAAVEAPATVQTRRATAADVHAVRTLYDTWAREQNGPLTRQGPPFTDDELMDGVTGITLAEDGDGTAVGYAAWIRGGGYGEEETLAVDDLQATTPDAFRALLAAVGSFVSVTGRTTVETSGDDLVRLFLPSSQWQTVDEHPYMLALLDVPGALQARRYPRSVSAALGFGVHGLPLAEGDGDYVLEVSGGEAVCRRTTGRDRVFAARGLALCFAGAQSSANLRAAGLLQGGDPAEDPDWDALFGGRQVHIRDYF